MLGAIIGDLAGSIYEFEQIKNCHPIKVGNIIEEKSFFSDDTILTVSIADAILNNVDYETKLKEYALAYDKEIPHGIPYFKTMFSPSFTKWAKGNFQGESAGNGAMMRVSPVGYLFNTEEEVIENALLATIPSHNSEEAIKSAKIISLIIFYARNGLSKQEIITKLDLKFKQPNLSEFNYTCSTTIDLCLYSLFNSNSFEESIKLAISFGGDTDTNACIVGSMAEAMFGIDEALKENAISKLPHKFKRIIKDFYASVNNNVKSQKN